MHGITQIDMETYSRENAGKQEQIMEKKKDKSRNFLLQATP